MIENAGLTDTLGKNLSLYIIGTITVFALSLLPTVKAKRTSSSLKQFTIVSTLIYGTSIVLGIVISHNAVSPLSSTCKTTVNIAQNCIFKLQHRKADSKEIINFFYRDSISTNFCNYGTVQDKPNIIVIFCEGLSSEVIDSYNDLDLELTPNLDKLHSEALSFDNYYNHTAATFRGLRGQLYSGFQYRGGYGITEDKGFAEIHPDDISSKTEVKIKSLVNILDENGYDTCFINPEPEHSQTVNYLKTLGFKNLVPENGEKKITDKEGFELLRKQISTAEAPFFISFYNIGTHHGFDSPDEKYGNGKNSILNKYYNGAG